MDLVPYLHQVIEGRSLDADAAREAMTIILEGRATTAQIAALLVALRMKGETGEELYGFARAMREKAARVDAGDLAEPLLDTCGTGGDGGCTFNISTLVAFVVAGAGVRVAKHGNRSLSSQCGSADVLEGLGITVAPGVDAAARAIREIGIGFLFAPAIHPAMKHAQPARMELKLRTAFNLLGPLTNPAGATAQLAGAPSPRAAELMADALARFGLRRGFVVHGEDGLDEITTTGSTIAFEVRAGAVTRHTLAPEDFGVPRSRPDDLRGGDRDTNCEIVRAVLRGATGAPRDIVLVNAAAALVAAERAVSFMEGMALAAHSIDSGAAWRKVEQLAAFR
jgi:anthranilate phosphoribosyltransferase